MQSKPVHYRVREIAEARGIQNAYQLMLETKVSRSAAKRLWSGRGNLHVETLKQAADALGVSIKELFVEETEGNRAPVDNGHRRQTGTLSTGSTAVAMDWLP
jgi:transcriptional regulator with XRE-family HTH domain